ncbi:replication protein [Pseudogracilibacillus auburnensis]|uniref:replication protein n=1 Tax=Pseudogracilibacillus auburnensis TaxID=1494959 RepID=UPI001A96BC83|nr:replication protein [Pseudogracilibacillus auburnensis]MBO1005761.1 replication protein [Pseudogracilibacillus auburnensis]
MENFSSLERAQYHAWFHHHDSDGWITVAKRENGTFRQYHYQPEELANELTKWLGEDVFFSQNTFFKPERSIQNIRQLRSLYIDLDFYLFNYDMSWVIGKLEHDHFGKDVPDPNILIFSGQGLVLIWLLDPVPYKALPLWQAVQNYFLETLANLGGDPKAADAARIFRIPGSVNSKNGNEVRAEYRHDHKYELRQIQYDYLPELNDEVRKSSVKRKGRKKKVANLFNTYKLHYARLMDLVKLVELRNYKVTGHRETICFLYRYWLCCYSNDPTEALNQTVSLNLQFTSPLSLKEVERATRSAEKAWEARNNEEANKIAIEKGYPGAGYNVSNKKLIEWLDVTDGEQQHLTTIIGPNEKRKRKKVANMEMRREQGVKPREEYLKEQQEKTDDNLSLLRQLMKESPDASNYKLAALMGISESYVRKLKLSIK